MAKKTEHYQLNQWEAEDSFLRTDFNEDNAKIDAALAAATGALPKIATGSYTGNGKYGSANPKSIEIGFAAKLVVIIRDDHNINFSGLFLRPCSYGVGRFDSGTAQALTWTNTGVTWHNSSASSGESQLNTNGVVYRWWAIG